jgi:hypothetical protein
MAKLVYGLMQSLDGYVAAIDADLGPMPAPGASPTTSISPVCARIRPILRSRSMPLRRLLIRWRCG